MGIFFANGWRGVWFTSPAGEFLSSFSFSCVAEGKLAVSASEVNGPSSSKNESEKSYYFNFFLKSMRRVVRGFSGFCLIVVESEEIGGCLLAISSLSSSSKTNIG